MATSRSELRRSRNRLRRTRRRIAVAAVTIVLVAGAAAAAVVVSRQGGHRSADRTPGRRVLSTAVPEVVPPCNVVVSLNGSVPAYAGPEARVSSLQLGPEVAGQAFALPVIDQVGSWLEVRVSSRPNGLTAWLPASSGRELADPYRIVVDLGHERVFLYRSGQILLQAPAAVGAPTTPTPLGNFYVTELAQSPSADFGPFVVVTSATTDALTDWEENNRPVIAITGPRQWQSAIGTPNGAATAGGIALQNADLSALRPVPLGTPVDVVASWNPPPPPVPRHPHPGAVPKAAHTTAVETVPPVAPFPMGVGCVPGGPV